MILEPGEENDFYKLQDDIDYCRKLQEDLLDRKWERIYKKRCQKYYLPLNKIIRKIESENWSNIPSIPSIGTELVLFIIGISIFMIIGNSVFSGTANQEMITKEESIVSFIDNKDNPVYVKYSFKWNGGSTYLLESRERCIAFISYYLTEIGENDGHTWCSVDILKAAVEDSAPECIDVFDGVIENNSFLHQYENRIGLKLYYNLEMKILSIIQERLNKPSPVPIENDEIETGIAKAEQEQGFTYTDEQKAIIRSILTQSISFVTGKAGTGKSSILRGIIRAYSLANYNISACALSAMAAQRITEATDYPAMTIHRTLGCHGPNKFDYNKDCKLISPVLLMDEASMVNVQIFLAWLEAIAVLEERIRRCEPYGT